MKNLFFTDKFVLDAPICGLLEAWRTSVKGQKIFQCGKKEIYKKQAKESRRKEE